jgi:hypothetical protein
MSLSRRCPLPDTIARRGGVVKQRIDNSRNSNLTTDHTKSPLARGRTRTKTIIKLFFLADFGCFEKIIIEIKAVTKLTNEYKAEIIRIVH